MSTAYFKELGVEFVDDDEINCSDWTISLFAWRDLSTLPHLPKFKFEVDSLNHAWRPMLDQESTKPVFTQSMADAGDKIKDLEHELSMHKKNSELLGSLTKFMVNNGIGIAGESCIDVAIREISEKRGIKSQREKAIEEFGSDIDDVWHGMGASELAEELFSVGYRKLTPAQAKMYDDKTGFFGEQI